MDKWFKDILPDKDPYHNRGRDQMRKKGGPESNFSFVVQQIRYKFKIQKVDKMEEKRQRNSYLSFPQALEFRTPLFPHLIPPSIMVWIFVWKYIFEPFEIAYNILTT
jgi:hypothetical protein